jgi:hypothetical protein
MKFEQLRGFNSTDLLIWTTMHAFSELWRNWSASWHHLCLTSREVLERCLSLHSKNWCSSATMHEQLCHLLDVPNTIASVMRLITTATNTVHEVGHLGMDSHIALPQWVPIAASKERTLSSCIGLSWQLVYSPMLVQMQTSSWCRFQMELSVVIMQECGKSGT